MFSPFLLIAQVEESPVNSEEYEQELIMGEGPNETMDAEMRELAEDDKFDESQQSSNWKTHANKDYKIEYPTTWELNTEGLMGTSFLIFSPLEGPEDDFRENVNLFIQDLQGAKISMEEYVKLSEDQLASVINDYKPNFSKSKKQNGHDIHHISYFGKQGIYDLEFEQQIYLTEGKAYILTFTREIDSPASWQKSATEIFGKFNLEAQ